jgi:hypothetical protein
MSKIQPICIKNNHALLLGILGIVWSGIQVNLHNELLPFTHMYHQNFRSIRNNCDLPVWHHPIAQGPKTPRHEGKCRIVQEARSGISRINSKRRHMQLALGAAVPENTNQLA